jgi:hypothetical protein
VVAPRGNIHVERCSARDVEADKQLVEGMHTVLRDCRLKRGEMSSGINHRLLLLLPPPPPPLLLLLLLCVQRSRIEFCKGKKNQFSFLQL